MSSPIRWTSRLSFIFATAAAAIGLGNIWRFPYLAGEYGGSAFVLIYLFFVVVLGIPLMTSEVMLGRMGRANPVRALITVAHTIHRSRQWGRLGGLTILAGFLILSYYLVIAGWVFEYFFITLFGHFHHATQVSVASDFRALQSNYWEMLFFDTLLSASTVAVIALGIKRGLERTVMIMFPAF